MRENSFKLGKGRFRLDMRKKFFTVEGGETLEWVAREVEEPPPWRHSRPGWMGFRPT